MSKHLIFMFKEQKYEASSFVNSILKLMDDNYPKYNSFHIEIDYPPIDKPELVSEIALYGEK